MNRKDKNLFGNFDLILHSVTKEEIIKQDIKRINEYINKLRSDLVNSCGKMMITFDGYDNDTREIYEIEEIRKYISKLFNQNKDLFYYITTIEQNNKLILTCLSNFRQIKLENCDIVTLEIETEVSLKKQIIQGVLSCANNNIEHTNKVLENLFNK